jgi:hypothetical protein
MGCLKAFKVLRLCPEELQISPPAPHNKDAIIVVFLPKGASLAKRTASETIETLKNRTKSRLHWSHGKIKRSGRKVENPPGGDIG